MCAAEAASSKTPRVFTRNHPFSRFWGTCVSNGIGCRFPGSRKKRTFVHPHDPYKRIDLLHSSRHIEVLLDGVKVADTRRPTVLYETGAPLRYYIPKPDVRMDLLEPTDKRTGCAQKALARYWSLSVGNIKRENIAWSYVMPIADCEKLRA